MRKQPFHRRILPWIFAITFIGVAPALVFYTAGYRWNPKKGKIERNGTIIIDSIPTASDIAIDGRPIADQTPITIQNMSPGVHQFSVTKNGYFPWGKSFEVIPEHVIFANDIRLWKQTAPVFSLALTRSTLSLSPDERHALVISSTTPTQLSVIDIRTFQKSSPTPITIAVNKVLWSPNGRYAVLEPHDGGDVPWLMDTGGKQQPTQLPLGRYRWAGSELVGNDSTSLLSIRLSDFSLSRTPLTSNRVDLFDGIALITPTGTTELALVDEQSPQKGLLLPRQRWNFWDETPTALLLRNNTTWLSIIKNDANPDSHTAVGDLLRPSTLNKNTRYLLIHSNELWAWDPLTEPELLHRQSEPIVDAAWFHDGKNVFYATTHEVRALNLDTRDGRQETPLAQFDEITGIAASAKLLFISGTKNDQTGIWSLAVE